MNNLHPEISRLLEVVESSYSAVLPKKEDEETPEKPDAYDMQVEIGRHKDES